MLDDSILFLLNSNLCVEYRLLTAFLGSLSFGILRTKIIKNSTFIWWMSRAMNDTGWFWSIPCMVYIPLLVPDRYFTHIGVIFLQVGFSSCVPAVAITVSLCSSRFFIRKFYNTFINRFRNLHALKHIYIFFCNLFAFKILHVRFIDPAIWHTVQNNFIQLCLTNFSLAFAPGNLVKYSSSSIIRAA